MSKKAMKQVLDMAQFQTAGESGTYQKVFSPKKYVKAKVKTKTKYEAVVVVVVGGEEGWPSRRVRICGGHWAGYIAAEHKARKAPPAHCRPSQCRTAPKLWVFVWPPTIVGASHVAPAQKDSGGANTHPQLLALAFVSPVHSVPFQGISSRSALCRLHETRLICRSCVLKCRLV